MPRTYKKTGKPTGRPRKNYSFDEARAFIRAEGVQSVHQYKKWWAFNRPSRMPKRPDRAYQTQWTSWAHFLSSENAFPFIKSRFLPFEQARSAMHALGFKSYEEYRQSMRDRDDNYDKQVKWGIPLRPDMFYQKHRKWTTWRDFLGYDMTSRLAVKTESPPILAIMKHPRMPNGVYRFQRVSGGIVVLQHILSGNGMSLITAYETHRDFAIASFVNSRTQPSALGDEIDRYAANVNTMIFELDNLFSRVSI